MTCILLFISLTNPSQLEYRSPFIKMQISDTSGPLINNFSFSGPDVATFPEYYRGFIDINVIDGDGVDAVWMQFRWADQSSWSTRTMEKQSPPNNDTYSAEIEGDLDSGYNRFFVEFFANDTLGNLSESQVYNDTVYYTKEEGPPSILDYLLPALAISGTVFVLIGLGFWLYKKRR